MAATLVLTRPQEASREIAAALGGAAEVVISPVLDIAPTGAAPGLGRYRGVILTSANAVAHAPEIAGKRAYCVGKRTAEAARAVGADVALVARTADELVRRVDATGPLIHLRGERARGDIAKRLSSAGIETNSAVVYRQGARALSREAKAAIEGRGPVVLPLYSPRSAALAGAGLARLGPGLRVIAMSEAVARAWRAATGAAVQEVCGAPTGDEMLARIRAALRHADA